MRTYAETMPRPLVDALWNETELPALLNALARAANLEPLRADLSTPFAIASMDAWMETACAHLGLEAQPLTLRCATLADTLENAAPAILRAGGGYCGLLRARRGRACLIAPDGSRKQIRLRELESQLLRPLQEPIRKEVQTVMHDCGLDDDQSRRAVDAMLRERIGNSVVAAAWQLRTPAGAGLWRQMRETGLSRRLYVLFAAHALEYALWVASWRLIGKGVLEGRVDSGWMAAWLLILVTMLPFRLLTTWTQGVLSIGFGGLLRQRLLAGALNLEPEQIRREGAGLLLGRTLESETLESFALSGGITSLLALVESGFALAVIACGAGGTLQSAAFVAWIGIALLAGWRGYRKSSSWTAERLAMTHDLIERMSGHRTRLAQQAPEQWHAGEDEAMDAYLGAAREMDRMTSMLTGFIPRAWLVIGILSLAPTFIAPQSSPVAMAIGIGGVLLGYRALNRLTSGASQLAGAWIAWRQVGPLYRAASQSQAPGGFVAPESGNLSIDARELAFHHAGRAEPVLSGASLAIRPGDRILLEGPSGGGKSTLSSLLSGMRAPSSGLLLAGGLDRATLGSRAWRRIVASAPQYHENHVLTGTFAFNLLMGRQWPPSVEDLDEARAVCQELGLRPLLERMPGGLDQMVGETGWQLSQGERSRLFMARALLQKSSLVILDETFAALDPENLRQAMECTLRRAKTLLVVAHP